MKNIVTKLSVLSLLVLALCLVSAPAVFADDVAEAETVTETAVVESTATAETVGVEVAADEDGLPITAVEAVLNIETAAFCPWYTISCSRDRQCDAYCGAKGAGACESFCCACLF